MVVPLWEGAFALHPNPERLVSEGFFIVVMAQVVLVHLLVVCPLMPIAIE